MLWWFAPRRWFNFSGRASRRELLGYWAGVLLIVVLIPVLLVGSFDPGARQADSPMNPVLLGFGVLSSVVQIAGMIALLAVEVRRLHDSEKSGWNIFWGMLPLIGGIIVLVMLFLPGDDFENLYGADPRDRLEAELGDLEQIF